MRKVWLALVLLLMLGGLLGVARLDWVAQRGPAPVWQAAVGGPLNHPPLLSGSVLLAAPEGGPLLAFYARTGHLLWTFAPEAGVWERSVAVEGDTVFVAARDGRVYALNLADGRVRWQQSLAPLEPRFPMLVRDGQLFIATKAPDPITPDKRAALFVLRATDGMPLWQFVGAEFIYQRPFVTDDTIYLAGSFFGPPRTEEEAGWMRLYAIDRQTHRPRWRYRSEDGFVKTLYVYGDTLAYLAYQDRIVALDTASGQARWQRDTGNWTQAFLGVQDRLFFGAANTRVHCWDLRTGETVWTYDIGGGSFNYMLSAPVALPQQVLFLTQRGDLVALDRNTGRERWVYATGRMARVGLSAAPWGMLFFGDEQGILHAYRFFP